MSSNMINKGVSFKTVHKGLKVGLATPTLVYNLVGYSGIGKTALVRQVVKELGGEVAEINTTLLQEGDLAMPVKHEEEGNKPTVVYVVNDMITKVNNKAKENKDKIYVLFFDEFNRARAGVQSELMNLILQRQIFDITLEDNVRIVTAQNPDRTTEGFEHTNYDVQEVDEATASRVVDIRMRFSAQDWLDYGTTYDENRGRFNVHPMVTSYIANGNEDMLLVFNPDKRNTPSPRNWSRVGELLYDMGIEELEGQDNDLINFVSESVVGIVGDASQSSFMSFARTFTNYIKVTDWLQADDDMMVALMAKYDAFDNTKKVVIIEDFIKYMVSSKENASDENVVRKVALVLDRAPMDTITNKLRQLTADFGKLFDGEKMVVSVEDGNGGTKEESHIASMVRYINFVNSNPKLREKQQQIIANSTVDSSSQMGSDNQKGQLNKAANE